MENRHDHIDDLLYLLARIVKGSVRYSVAGSLGCRVIADGLL